MAALHYQRETGRGQHIDVSIYETVASEVQLPPARYAYTGGVETRGPKEPPAFVKGFIELKDGYIRPECIPDATRGRSSPTSLAFRS